ncbi:hypothetical protein DKP78_18305, partial [Enterococcus faecium]
EAQTQAGEWKSLLQENKETCVKSVFQYSMYCARFFFFSKITFEMQYYFYLFSQQVFYQLPVSVA